MRKYLRISFAVIAAEATAPGHGDFWRNYLAERLENAHARNLAAAPAFRDDDVMRRRETQRADGLTPTEREGIAQVLYSPPQYEKATDYRDQKVRPRNTRVFFQNIDRTQYQSEADKSVEVAISAGGEPSRRNTG